MAMKEQENFSSGKDIANLAQRWIHYFGNLPKQSAHTEQDLLPDEDFEVIEALDQLIKTDCDKAWLVILEICKHAKSDLDLANLAAGPLEDLLVKHGAKIIERVEQHSAINSKFKETLSGIWKNAIPDDIWCRIEKARS